MTTGSALRVGELRPSQLLWAFGVGALVDLPHIAVIVRGLDDWNPNECTPLTEERLLANVRRKLGPQVERLLAPPLAPQRDGRYDPFAPDARIGVPVSSFPEWLRCPFCGLIAPVSSGLFDIKSDLFRPDYVKYVHANCQKARSPDAVPARFLVACRDGHLDDFPWRFFVHRGATGCTGQLYFFEQGASLETANLWVGCRGCDTSARSMIDAFDREAHALPQCRGAAPAPARERRRMRRAAAGDPARRVKRVVPCLAFGSLRPHACGSPRPARRRALGRSRAREVARDLGVRLSGREAARLHRIRHGGDLHGRRSEEGEDRGGAGGR